VSAVADTIVDTAEGFRRALAELPAEPWGPPAAREVLLVAPDGFRLAEESQRDNLYMARGAEVSAERALAEHGRLARALAGSVRVHLFPGDPRTPDAVFPNNVFATAPGRVVVGRMRHGVRRLEAERGDLRAFLLGRGETRLRDLSGRDDLVAELTGPLVIDRRRGIGYCGLSERCDRAGAAAMHEAFGLRLTYVFELAAGEYHANVVLAVLAGRACVLHAGSFADPETPAAIAAAYPLAIRLDDSEKAGFVANCLALDGPEGEEVWLSARAAAALAPAHRAALEGAGFRLRPVAIEEIEKAGGSLRCCLCELF
jgi:hypothetical protein